MLLLRARLRQFTPSLWLDGLIGLLTLGATSAALVLPRELPRVATGTLVAGLVYPCADLVLLALVLWAGAITGWRGGRTWLWLSGAFAVAAAGDIALHMQLLAGGYDEPALSTAAFPLAMMAVAVAGRAARGAERRAAPTRSPYPCSPARAC